MQTQQDIDSRLDSWDKIDKDTYKFILDQAKERLGYLKSEEESITDKSIKMLTVTVTFIGLFIGILVKEARGVELYKILIVATCTTSLIVYLVLLIKPKETKSLGLAPLNILVENFGKGRKAYFEAKAYYVAIVTIQDNINFLMAKQRKRSKYYYTALILFCLQLIAMTFFVINLIIVQS